MKKKTLGAGLAAVAATVLVPCGPCSRSALPAQPERFTKYDQPGTITIQSWLYTVPSENVLSFTTPSRTR